MKTAPDQTPTQADWVYGPGGPPTEDDPTETYHEASKVYPSFAGRDFGGARRLASNERLQRATMRASTRHPVLDRVQLPDAPLPEVAFATALSGRQSVREFADESVRLADVAVVLRSAYGATGRRSERGLIGRPVPSGGGLYPLDVYLVPRRVEGLAGGIYRFDPFRDDLERSSADDAIDALTRASAYPEIVSAAACTLVLTASFWRSRFKYGPRSYRFILLEAGHAAQNALLALAALDLAAVPLGGFYDGRLDDLLDLDGLHRGSLYEIAFGPGAA